MRKRGNDYFEILTEQADCCLQAADCLQDQMKHVSGVYSARRLEEVYQIRARGRERERLLPEKLLREFLPPIGREDIMELSRRLEGVSAALEETARDLYMFNIQRLRPETILLAELVCRCCSAVKELLKEFCNFRKSDRWRESIGSARRLIEESNQVYTKAVRHLWEQERDASQLFRWSTVFHSLKQCCDCCGKVADAAELAVIKNL